MFLFVNNRWLKSICSRTDNNWLLSCLFVLLNVKFFAVPRFWPIWYTGQWYAIFPRFVSPLNFMVIHISNGSYDMGQFRSFLGYHPRPDSKHKRSFSRSPGKIIQSSLFKMDCFKNGLFHWFEQLLRALFNMHDKSVK